MKPIQRYEYGRLIIGEERFSKKHWDACVKLNAVHEGKYFEVLYNGLKFNQYVGVIQIENLIIEILPKADKDEADDPKWQKVLLGMLKACGHLKAETYDSANVSRQNLNLLEVYFEMYLKELEKLQRLGLIKQYRKETSNVKALKGKLEFAGNIRKNVVHKERFYTTHQVYDADHQLHQVLAVAISIISQFTKGHRLSNLCNRVQMNFPDVSKINVSASLLNKITLNRKSAQYTTALELARLIILNYSPDIKGGKEKMLSLLFDMNQLWEEYILVMMRKYIAQIENNEIEVAGQESFGFWGSNSLRPDIVIRKGERTFVIDTKWKQPSRNSASVADLRQMYTYCRFWNADKAILLYPGDTRGNKFKEFKTEDFNVIDKTPEKVMHQCKMGYISVLNEDNKLNDQVGKEVFMLFDDQLLNLH